MTSARVQASTRGATAVGVAVMTASRTPVRQMGSYTQTARKLQQHSTKKNQIRHLALPTHNFSQRSKATPGQVL